MRNYDWPAIRAGWERGLSATELARTIPNCPTRQAVEKRAKREGWEVARLQDNTPATVLEGDAATKAVILSKVRKGVPFKVDAMAAGISEKTLYNWKDADSVFTDGLMAARAAFLSTNLERIDEAADRDWKAASYLIERSPETKEQYAPKSEGSGGVVVVLKIDRSEGVTIDGQRLNDRNAD